MNPANLAIEEQARLDLEHEAERQKRQDDMREDRENRFRSYQGDEKRIDDALLFSGPSPFENAYPGSQWWFISNDMTGRPGYVLQHLGRIVKENLSQEILKEIEAKATDNSWITHPFSGFPDDVPSYGDGNDDQHRIWYLKGLTEEIMNTVQPAGADDWVWDSIYVFFALLQKLRLARRFTDQKNPETGQKALPDGSNLEPAVLRLSWALHRSWIRALHYRSLFIGQDDYGWIQIQQILQLTMGFYAGEMTSIPLASQDNPIEFSVLRTVYSAVEKALNEIAILLAEETRPQPKNRPYENMDTINYNITSGRLFTLFKEKIKGLDNFHLLLGLLFTHAKDFNDRMDIEHVEDCLINKRVVIDDEEYDLNELMGPNYQPGDINRMSTPGYREAVVHPVLRRITHINRLRRNYLLIRDWSKLRPWKQLYYIFNTESGSGEEHFRQPIADFYSYMAMLDSSEPISDSPSRKANIWAGLFTTHPIASHDPSSIKHYTDGCVICLEEFKPKTTIIQLHCDHIFHQGCIREYWDHPGRYTYTCVLCRTASAWLLHQQVGIRPEVLDVFDNAEFTGAEYAALHPNLLTLGEARGDHYWIVESDKLILSRNWARERGNAPYSNAVEMANMRQRRRIRNRRKRLEIQESGRGITGLE